MPYIQVYEKMLIVYKKKIKVIKQKKIPVAKRDMIISLIIAWQQKAASLMSFLFS